jgi:hypothetical protein
MNETLRGRRVRLIFTDDPMTGLMPGSEGTISKVDDAGVLHVSWDDGSQLALIAAEGDRWELL